MTNFQRYLRAKRTVDDRALDRRLLGDLRDHLAARAATADGPVRVLDIGAGIGTMLTRFVEWDVLPPGEVRYTAVDVQDANVDSLPEYLREWAADRDCSVAATDTLVLETADHHIRVEPVVADAVAYADDATASSDLLVGAALLDILDLNALEQILSALAPGGVYYFPITFDGATRFRPAHPADRHIEHRYHDHMDEKPGGSSRAGGDALARLRRLDGVSVDAAGSDWVVLPEDGGYTADEAYFLGHILDTVERAVGEMVDDESQLSDWLETRRKQLAAGELSYHTHQLDLLGRVDQPAALDGRSE